MKVLIIPDVHGREFWRKAIEMKDDVDIIIFLGDYLDPYTVRENITFEDAMIEFEDIIQFKKDNLNKVVLLLGNHDLAYLYEDLPTCRNSIEHAEKIKSLFTDNLDLFKLAGVLEDKYLFSHAGITSYWLEETQQTLDDLCTKSLDDIRGLGMVGYQRYGLFKTGSVVWCDIYEFAEDPARPYFQIFGHTQMMKEYIADNWACLDCRHCFILDSDTSKITKLEND